MANEMIKGMGFSHMAVAAKDFDRSLAFYRRLGLKMYTQWGEGDERIALLDIGDGGKLEIFARPDRGDGDGTPWVHFAFAVQNVDEAYRVALKAGATPVTPPIEMPLNSHPLRMTLRVAFVKGPDGEELEFFKHIIRQI